MKIEFIVGITKKTFLEKDLIRVNTSDVNVGSLQETMQSLFTITSNWSLFIICPKAQAFVLVKQERYFKTLYF